MAKKRMFSMQIIDSDAFLDMPLSTQCLYFHLNMRADDDGFIDNPKRIMRMIGASEDDLKILFAKNFVIGFETGVIVIKHWRLHNTLRTDRYEPTAYTSEKSMLELKENKSYTLGLPNGCQMVATDKISIDKNSIDKNSIDILFDSLTETSKEIIDYLNLSINSNYRYNGTKTQGLIKARLNERFTVDDFKTVIDKKVAEWKGTDMEKYLRPETLFGTKFESYLNQQDTKPFRNNNGQRDLLAELMNCEVD